MYVSQYILTSYQMRSKFWRLSMLNSCFGALIGRFMMVNAANKVLGLSSELYLKHTAFHSITCLDCDWIILSTHYLLIEFHLNVCGDWYSHKHIACKRVSKLKPLQLPGMHYFFFSK